MLPHSGDGQLRQVALVIRPAIQIGHENLLGRNVVKNQGPHEKKTLGSAVKNSQDNLKERKLLQDKKIRDGFVQESFVGLSNCARSPGQFFHTVSCKCCHIPAMVSYDKLRL